jgi:hypothetical protein
MERLARRRWIGRAVRAGLVVVAIGMVGLWLARRVPRAPDIRIQSEAPTAASLAPGDAQIFSRDSAVNLVLKGDNVLAGLSPKTIARVREEMERSARDVDTSSIGGSIAQFVKQTVADKIGTHVVYPIADMRDIRYDDGEIVIVKNNGSESRLFSGVKMNNEPLSKAFDEADARRFVELVKARKRSLP